MLQMTAMKLDGYDKDTVASLIGLVKPILDHRKELYARYARKRGPNERMSGGVDAEGRERAVVAFEYYIVNMVQGYLGGKAPNYSVRKGDRGDEYAGRYVKAIEQIRRYNDDAATFIELIHDYLITTAAYLYIYENQNNEIVYTRFDSLQTVAVYDYSTPVNQIGCIRVWTQQDDDGENEDIVEIVSERKIRRFVGRSGVYSEHEPERIAWGDIPCVSFENPDGIAVFEPAISPIDTYEQIVTNVRNMTQYNDDAKLLVSGYRPDEPLTVVKNGAEIPNLKRADTDRIWLEAPVMFVGEGGDIRWLLKSVDYSGALDVLKNQHDLITMLTGVPNMTDDAFSSADNASALGYKLYALDQYSATTDRVFRKGYLRLWEIITNRLNIKGAGFDFRDIDIAMQRNIPTDRDKSISRAALMKSSGLFSDQTCIEESQIEVDAKDELIRRDAEEEQDYETIKKRNAGGEDGRTDRTQ